MSQFKIQCPKCGSTDLCADDFVPAKVAIESWSLDANGVLQPQYIGGSEMDWDGQRPMNRQFPYGCRDCLVRFSPGELLASERVDA